MEKESMSNIDPPGHCNHCGHHTKCHDCGRFLEKKLWVPKDHGWKKHALCTDCFNNYDSPYDY